MLKICVVMENNRVIPIMSCHENERICRCIFINIQRQYTMAIGSNKSVRKIAVFSCENFPDMIQNRNGLALLHIDNYCTRREILNSVAPRAILLYSCNNY